MNIPDFLKIENAKNGKVHLSHTGWLTAQLIWAFVFCILKMQVLSRRGRERGGLVVNASDSGSKGRRFDPNFGQTVLCP